MGLSNRSNAFRLNLLGPNEIVEAELADKPCQRIERNEKNTSGNNEA
jgi:hypothetical protein